MSLYNVARQVNHEFGFDWTDPRTGITHKTPKKQAVKAKRQKAKKQKKRRATSGVEK